MHVGTASEGRRQRPAVLLKRLRDRHCVRGDARVTPDFDNRDWGPGVGMQWLTTRSAEDTAGELLERTMWMAPRMAGPPVHVHPMAEESFEVLEGAIEVLVHGTWSAVGSGETAVVPSNEPHSLRNLSDEPAKIGILEVGAGGGGGDDRVVPSPPDAARHRP